MYKTYGIPYYIRHWLTIWFDLNDGMGLKKLTTNIAAHLNHIFETAREFSKSLKLNTSYEIVNKEKMDDSLFWGDQSGYNPFLHLWREGMVW
jgi:hypothetical protein